jgi:hypothetical protein
MCPHELQSSIKFRTKTALFATSLCKFVVSEALIRWACSKHHNRKVRVHNLFVLGCIRSQTPISVHHYGRVGVTGA